MQEPPFDTAPYIPARPPATAGGRELDAPPAGPEELPPPPDDPPPERLWEEPPPWLVEQASTDTDPVTRPPLGNGPDPVTDVESRTLRLLGSYDGERAGKLLDWLDDLVVSAPFETFGERRQRTWQLTVSALRMTYGQSRASRVALDGELVAARVASPQATGLLAEALEAAARQPVEDRHALWQLTCDDVAAARTRTRLLEAVRVLEQRGDHTDEDVAKVFEEATRSHPFARASNETSSSPPMMRGDQAAERIAARKAAGKDIRLSSGFPMLDYALTRFHKGEMRGVISRGEYGVIYSGSGVGKSALFRVLIRNVIVDMVERHNMEYGVVILAFTEEDEDTILDAMEMLPGQRFHRYARNLVLAPVNGDIDALHRAVCQTLAEQVKLANRLGLPLDEVLPPLVAVDYVSAVAQNLPNPMTSGLERVTNYLMRGVRTLDRKMLETYGGVPFSAITGEEWDSRLDATELKSSVIAVSQINKKAEEIQVYRPGAPLDQYTKLGANGRPVLEPVVTDTGVLDYQEWQPQPGDQPVLEAEAMIGTSQVKKDVWWAIQLHRSRPDLKPVTATMPDGTEVRRLEDTRARLYLSKTRYSANLEVVPFAFDSGPNGFGMWFDVLSVDLWNRGVYTPWVPTALEPWQPGDPLLPWPQHGDLFDVLY